MSAKIIKTDSRIRLSLTAVQKELKTVPPKAYNFFYFKTPIDSGNARSKTKLKGDVISANYPYAGKLDRGHSKQSPDGMSKPTLKYIRDLTRKIFGR